MIQNTFIGNPKNATMNVFSKSAQVAFVIVFGLSFLTGCGKLLYQQDVLVMELENNTETQLVLEREHEYVADYYEYVTVPAVNDSMHANSLWIGTYQGNFNDLPPENEVLVMLHRMNVYRFVEGVKQYLPRVYFENLNHFEIVDDGHDLGEHFITYKLVVTEEMF